MSDDNPSHAQPVGPGYAVNHYVLETLLGEGGMGAVYLARDSKLNRHVAIKFLSRKLSDSTARRRFQREAQLASSLNHPHILTVHDAGDRDGVPFLVTEYVDGGTLSDWIKSASRSSAEVAELLTGIADALAAAHAAGIMHRDIKPANILVSRNGYAKLADFGLAKLQERVGPNDETRWPDAPTMQGVVIGTIGYLSPEQAAGMNLDERSDIFSFGVVLYEMLAGHRPFTGSNDLQILKRILHEAPKPLEGNVPDALRAIVARCLEKDPEQRYQSIREVVVALKQSQKALVAPRLSRRRIKFLTAIAAGLAVTAGAVAWQLWQRDYFWKNPLADATAQQLTDFPGDELDAVISPDGKFVGYLSDRAGQFDVWNTVVGTGESVNVTGGRFPLLYPGPIRYVGFSGDSARLWFLEQISLRPQRLRAWISQVPEIMPTVFLASGMNPEWSPDGARIVYHTPEAGDPVFIAGVDGKNPKQIHVDKPGMHNHFPTWSPDGRHLYFVKGVVTTDQLDIWRMAISPTNEVSTPERITYHDSRVGYLAWLDSRTLIYSATAADGSGQWLYAIDTDHRIPHRVSTGITEQYLSVSVSSTKPRRLAVTVARPEVNLWTVPISSGIETEEAVRAFPTPNARALAPRYGAGFVLFLSTKGGPDGLWKIADGSARELWRGNEGGLVGPAAVSPDGTQICFSYRRNGRAGLYVMRADGSKVRMITQTLDVRGTVSWSPDSQWIAFAGTPVASDKSVFEPTRVYKIAVEGGPPVSLTNPGTSRPLWSPDGSYIVFSEPIQGGRMLVRAVAPDGAAYPLPEMWVNYQTSTPYRFVPGMNALVYLRDGDVRRQNFFLMDLSQSKERQLTDLKPGPFMQDFDVSPDGTQLLFDRQRNKSDIVLMDLPR